MKLWLSGWHQEMLRKYLLRGIILEPIRTLTATIAGDMGEADHVLGSSRFHVLFAMAFCLLAFSFIMNLTSEIIIHRSRKKTGKVNGIKNAKIIRSLSFSGLGISAIALMAIALLLILTPII